MKILDNVLACLARAAANGRPENLDEIATLCNVDLSAADIRKSPSGDLLIVRAYQADFHGYVNLSTSSMPGYAAMMQFLGGEKLPFDLSASPLGLNWELFPAKRGDGYLARASTQRMIYHVMVENALGDTAFIACGPET